MTTDPNGLTDSWRNRAECHRITEDSPALGGAWIGERNSPEAEAAKSVCRDDCTVWRDCLVAALQSGGAEGIRGGFFFEEGALSEKDTLAVQELVGIKARMLRSTVYRSRLKDMRLSTRA